MPIDFSRLGSGGGSTLIDPRDIFAALPRKPWPRLRLEQGEVLKSWFSDRDRRDRVIKQNTGGGKTVVGLLIAQSSINEGKGPAAYLAPDTYLASQAVLEADRLGIAVTEDARDHRFLAGEAILVTTLHKMINGRSVFGVSGTGRPVTHVGTVVVDDAHSALNIAEGQFKVHVPAESDAYAKLFLLFSDSIKHQSRSAWVSLKEGQPSGPVRVPFWAWASAQDQVLDLLRQYGENDKEKWIYFAWPLVQQALHLASATFSEREIEIRTPCPAIELIPSFAQAQRRIYLTATLADDGVLVTELGARAEDLATAVTPERAADLGDRLILAPLAINPTVADIMVRRMVREIAWGDRDGTGTETHERVNAVVLVPSDRAAGNWDGYTDLVCHVKELPAVVERLKAGEHLGVVVLINKYDGIDLPHDACRLLVIDGVPTPLVPSEAREATALMGSEIHLARRVQRIEQGMGRGIRDAEDHCAVLLLGSDLAMTLTAPQALETYSPATRAQISLSRDLAQQINGEGLQAVRGAIGSFLARDPGWIEVSKRAIAGVEYDRTGHVGAVAAGRRRAFDLARAGQMREAGQALQGALNSLGESERAWFSEEAAGYIHAVDAERAQTVLREARLNNASVLLPLEAAPVKPLRSREQQAVASSAYLAANYTSPVELLLGVSLMLESIVFDPALTDQAESAFEKLGLHLGFPAERPDKLYGTGPDVLWAITDSTHALLELKTGVDRTDTRITKSETDQLSGHVSWHATNYGTDATPIPVFVHPDHTHRPNASPPPGALVITPDGVARLKDAVRGWATALSSENGWQDIEIVKSQLTAAGLVGRQVIEKFAVRPESAGA